MSAEHHELFQAIRDMAVAMRDNGILDESDPLLTQSFIEGETAVPEIIAGIIRSLDDDAALDAGLGILLDEYRQRRERVRVRMEQKRGLIELALMRADISRLETPAATVSLRTVPQAIGDVDEAALPSRYFDPQPPKLNRKRLLDDLKAGAEVEGATLTNGGVALQIRRH